MQSGVLVEIPNLIVTEKVNAMTSCLILVPQNS